MSADAFEEMARRYVGALRDVDEVRENWSQERDSYEAILQTFRAKERDLSTALQQCARERDDAMASMQRERDTSQVFVEAVGRYEALDKEHRARIQDLEERLARALGQLAQGAT